MAECCCGADKKEKVVTVSYLYLDLHTCERCIGTDLILESVLRQLAPALKLAGYTVDYRKIEIETEEMAQAYRFQASPTILVNGRDICDSVQENDCGCCGDIAGTQVDCRVFFYNGKLYEIPPKEMLAERILKLAFEPPLACCCGDTYTVPENLKRFFRGKAEACCGGGCSCC